MQLQMPGAPRSGQVCTLAPCCPFSWPPQLLHLYSGVEDLSLTEEAALKAAARPAAMTEQHIWQRASSCTKQSSPQAWLPDAALEAAAATSAAAIAAACASSATNLSSSGSHTYIVPSSSSNCCSSGGGVSALQATESIKYQAGLQSNNSPSSCRSCWLTSC